MINAGRNIRSNDDALQKIKVEYLYHSIRNPSPEVVSQIRQLRILKNIDHTQYVAQKRSLPYVVCGMFNPMFRRTENFAYTEYFIVDIDHVTEKGLDMACLRKKVESDSRVVLSFISPGEDGLKVMFRLKERCCDSGMYSIFYKAFVNSFSKLHFIEQVVDSKTSDVTRACFISMDEHAYYNPDAERVDMQSFIDLSNMFDLFEQKRQIEKDQREYKFNTPEEKLPIDPSEDTLGRIKNILNPNAAKKTEAKRYFVPGILEDIMSDLKAFIEETGAVITSLSNINYGKQIMVKVGMKFAEVNLFYGKHGFRVVRSNKSGTDREVTELIGQLVETFIDTYDR